VYFITLLAKEVVKYYNEGVCVCVCVCCLSASVCLCVSVYPRAYLPNHMRDLCPFLCMLLIDVTRSSSGGMTQSQGKEAILRVFPH